MFDKYSEYGAYHWDDIEINSIRDLISRSVPTMTRYDKILKFIPKKARIIADIGCGDGALTYLLAKEKHVEQVYGCDTDKKGIELSVDKVRSLPHARKITFLNESFEACKFQEQSIDAITMCDVIEHIEEIEPLLLEIKCVGKRAWVLSSTTQLKRENGGKWDEHHISRI